MKSTILSLLLAAIGLTTIGAQAVVSHHANDDGIYTQFGQPSVFSSPKTNLRLGNYKLNLTQFVVNRPTLHLNPLSGHVTIGPTDGDFAALTIRSFSETIAFRALKVYYTR